MSNRDDYNESTDENSTPTDSEGESVFEAVQTHILGRVDDPYCTFINDDSLSMRIFLTKQWNYHPTIIVFRIRWMDHRRYNINMSIQSYPTMEYTKSCSLENLFHVIDSLIDLNVYNHWNITELLEFHLIPPYRYHYLR